MPFRKELLNRLSSPTLHSNIQWRYLGRYRKATRSALTPQTGYHVTPAAALPVSEIRRDLSAAFRACYRGGRWIEATTSLQVSVRIPDEFHALGFRLHGHPLTMRAMCFTCDRS